jgi:hypothetical protein
LERVGERADVVFVAVGQEDAADTAGALGEVLEIGYDRIDTRHLGGGEEHAGVEEHEVLLPLEHERVEAELTEAAERDERTAVVSSASLELPCSADRSSRLAKALQTPQRIASQPWTPR